MYKKYFEAEECKQGHCPHCGNRVEYGFSNEYYEYEFECPVCGLKGIEIYSLNFVGMSTSCKEEL